MMTALGIAMNGLEEAVARIARDVAAKFDEVTYIEIGVGEGTTLTGIARELRMTKKNWRAIGIELPNGYSFSRARTEEIAQARGLPLFFVNPNGSITHPQWNAVTVYFKDSQSFLTEMWNAQVHLALIDGCHGKPCVTLDFLAVEAFMVPGGVMLFHDFSEEQKGDKQPHCPDGIDVRGACQDLGLTNGKRAGWIQSETLTANRLQGGWDMGVFTKDTASPSSFAKATEDERLRSIHTSKLPEGAK